MRAALAVLCLVAWSCGPSQLVTGNGDVTTVERALGEVHLVRLSLEADLVIETGPRPSLRLVGEGNLLTWVQSDEFLGELTLSAAPLVTLAPTAPLRFVLTLPSVRVVELDAPGSLEVQRLSGAEARATLRSPGTLVVDELDATTFVGEVHGAGDLSVRAGRVDTSRLLLTSSGNALTAGLEAKQSTADLGSSGSAEVWATERLDVELRSSGSVRFRGAPRLQSKRSSTGTVAPF